jgi:VWFA-related protein
MQALAKETGGVAYLSHRDVAKAVREALDDTRTTYVLKYAMSNLKFDGSSHAIKVETSRKDVKLRYRNGFFAPTQAPK